MNYKDLQQPIKIECDTTFRNFTGRYLLPQLKLLDKTFNTNFKKTKWLAFGLCDRKYEYYTEYDNKLFMLASNKHNIDYWLDHYEHYIYQDGEINKLMIIVELPINNRDNFLMGNYSQLYENNDLLFNKYIIQNNVQFLSSSYVVLNKLPEGKESFKERVKKDFNADVSDFSPSEYEYPPVMATEIFNYEDI